jgi:hypothetical protein
MAAVRDGSEPRFIGYYQLVDACARPGCPVCRCVDDATRRYVDALIYEQVTDPETRHGLRDSWGFCNWHAWVLEDTPGARFGAAIINVDLLGRMVLRARRLGDRPPGLARRSVAWIARLAGRRPLPALVLLHARRRRCPACHETARAEESYLHVVLDAMDDAGFREAYERSHGLCVPHTMRALARGAGRADTRSLIDLTAEKWEKLRGAVARFVSKHDYRNAEPVTDEETEAVLRAAAMLAGGRGLFGNDLHVPSTAPARRQRTAATAGSDVAALRAENERLRGEIAALKAPRDLTPPG